MEIKVFFSAAPRPIDEKDAIVQKSALCFFLLLCLHTYCLHCKIIIIENFVYMITSCLHVE